jgi:hypothetical protein
MFEHCKEALALLVAVPQDRALTVDHSDKHSEAGTSCGMQPMQASASLAGHSASVDSGSSPMPPVAAQRRASALRAADSAAADGMRSSCVGDADARGSSLSGAAAGSPQLDRLPSVLPPPPQIPQHLSAAYASQGVPVSGSSGHALLSFDQWRPGTGERPASQASGYAARTPPHSWASSCPMLAAGGSPVSSQATAVFEGAPAMAPIAEDPRVGPPGPWAGIHGSPALGRAPQRAQPSGGQRQQSPTALGHAAKRWQSRQSPRPAHRTRRLSEPEVSAAALAGTPPHVGHKRGSHSPAHRRHRDRARELNRAFGGASPKRMRTHLNPYYGAPLSDSTNALASQPVSASRVGRGSPADAKELRPERRIAAVPSPSPSPSPSPEQLSPNSSSQQPAQSSPSLALNSPAAELDTQRSQLSVTSSALRQPRGMVEQQHARGGARLHGQAAADGHASSEPAARLAAHQVRIAQARRRVVLTGRNLPQRHQACDQSVSDEGSRMLSSALPVGAGAHVPIGLTASQAPFTTVKRGAFSEQQAGQASGNDGHSGRRAGTSARSFLEAHAASPSE